MRKYIIIIVALSFISFRCYSQSESGEKFVPAIEDNSFLIEEAYNQEERVVQHISGVNYILNPSRNLMYSFTQEWPLHKYKHQISYSIPYSFLDRNSLRGIGDIMINYRYQLLYKESWACISPRFSLILPTGDIKKGLGYNVPGFQFDFPVSKRLSDFWVVHFNAGITVLPAVKGLTTDNSEIRKTLSFYNLGASVIWLTHANFNFMLECIENFNSGINTSGEVMRSSAVIINPGVRSAVNIGKLQIVPGFSVPLIIENQKINPGLFFYLSFEHPY
jgi:hypothetical protein